MTRTPPPRLTLQQQAFCLSWLSNAASDKVDTLARLQDQVRGSFEAFVADNAGRVAAWRLAWGPVASSHDGDDPAALHYADNMMYAAEAQLETGPCLVVGVAGTNEDDAYDWLAEDFSIARQVDWPYRLAGVGDLAAPKISQAMATGMAALLALRDPRSGGIQAFVDAWTKGHPGGTVIVAGHSLGGALAPTLALALVGLNGGPLAGARLLTLASAGQTPGDPAFAALYARLFPQPDDDGPIPFNTDIVNAHDLVPTAWNAVKLTGFFHNVGDLAFRLEMDGLLGAIDLLADGLLAFKVYAPIARQTFAADPPNVDYASLHDYFGLIVANHLAAYPTYFGVDGALDDTTAAMARATLRQVQTHARRLATAARARPPGAAT